MHLLMPCNDFLAAVVQPGSFDQIEAPILWALSLSYAVAEMDEARIHNFLLDRGCNWFEFKMNPPSASHMGGVWERQICSVCAILCAILQSSGQQLDDESFRTVMCEAEAIVNSRLLPTDGLTTPSLPEPLTPNHLLTMKANILLPPPGDFKCADLYSWKRWRRIQHLANEFWNRWKKDFLQSLQERQKWNRVCPTSRPMTLCCSRMTTFCTMNGSSHALLKPNLTQMV